MIATSVTFNLQFATRKDEDANVYVGFCPVLKLYSQGRTEKEAEAAIVDAAQLFITTCYERESLGKVLRSRGMVKAAPRSPEHEDVQFIRIEGYDRPFARDIPIELFPLVENLVACQ